MTKKPSLQPPCPCLLLPFLQLQDCIILLSPDHSNLPRPPGCSSRWVWGQWGALGPDGHGLV